MKESFLNIFFSEYYHHLGTRNNTFRMMFEYLDSLNQDKYLIVETGTTREKDNWQDGNSTIMFDKYCQINNGTVYTIDNYPPNCETVRGFTSNNTIVCLNDSVKFLHEFPTPEKIDLLYLDSFDISWDNPHPSSLHHLKELTSIYSNLKPGCLIVVDDCNWDGNKGKGQYVEEFLWEVGAKLYFEEYQVGYIKQ